MVVTAADRRLEKEYDYDASRMPYILDASLIAVLKFGRIIRNHAALMFSTLKYALGYGKSCSPIKIDGMQTEISRKAA